MSGAQCSFCEKSSNYGEIVTGPIAKNPMGGKYLCQSCKLLPRVPRFCLQQVRYDEVRPPPEPVADQTEPWRVETTDPGVDSVQVTWRCEVLVRPATEPAKDPNP